jgi:hypothetical protein
LKTISELNYLLDERNDSFNIGIGEINTRNVVGYDA